ncbi:MAG: hypothetical protein ICV81_09575, partial [Flavisolibacter sp.]|nr:hypothetical protein [Flavisolibacter sp.]
MKPLLVFLFCPILFIILFVLSCAAQKGSGATIKNSSPRIDANTYYAFSPGEVWYDDRGEVINAHGGGVLYV